MITFNEVAEIGKFQRTHALKGELNAIIDIDPEIIADPNFPVIVEFDGILTPFYCSSVRPKGHFSFLVKLDDINSEEDARPFVNKTAYGLKRILDEYQDDEEGGYATDFIGYTLIDTNDNKIGVIEDVDTSTDNALFIVESPNGTVYIPVAEEFISSIDDKNQIITVDLPDGLIDLNTR